MVEYVGPPVEPPVQPPVDSETWVKSRCRIGRTELILDIVCTVAWIAIAVSWGNVLTALDRVGFPHEIPIPSLELITQYYPWIVNVALVSIAVSVLKLIVGRWNLPVGLAHTVYQSMNGLLTVSMLNSGLLLRPETVSSWVATSRATTAAEIVATVDAWGAIIGVLVTIAIAIDIIVRWVSVARCMSRPAD